MELQLYLSDGLWHDISSRPLSGFEYNIRNMTFRNEEEIEISFVECLVYKMQAFLRREIFSKSVVNWFPINWLCNIWTLQGSEISSYTACYLEKCTKIEDI